MLRTSCLHHGSLDRWYSPTSQNRPLQPATSSTLEIQLDNDDSTLSSDYPVAIFTPKFSLLGQERARDSTHARSAAVQSLRLCSSSGAPVRALCFSTHPNQTVTRLHTIISIPFHSIPFPVFWGKKLPMDTAAGGIDLGIDLGNPVGFEQADAAFSKKAAACRCAYTSPCWLPCCIAGCAGCVSLYVVM